MKNGDLLGFCVLLFGIFLLVFGAAQAGYADGTWEQIGPWGGWMLCMVQAPLDPNVLFAGAVGLYKSTDGGASWEKLPVEQTRGVSACVAVSGSGEGPVATAFGQDYPFVSMDGGQSWQQVTDDVFTQNTVSWLSFTSHSAEGGSLVACTSKGLFASSDGLTGWQQVGDGIPTTTTITFFTCSAPGRPRYFFACGRNGGLYRSEQLESGWEALAIPQPDKAVWRVAVQWGERRNVFASGNAGLFKSTDGGTTWETIWAQQTDRVAIASSATTVVYAAGRLGLAISPDSGASWQTRQDGLVIGGGVSGDLVVSSQSPLDACVASMAGVYRTEDAGGSWHPSNQGIAAWQVTNMEVSDQAPGLIFAKCVMGGLFRKTQDTDWELPGASGTTIGLQPSWIALDPSDYATLYAWTGSTLIRSHDRGDHGTWETVLDLNCGAYGLAIDRQTGQNLYLATSMRGVMVSRDRGQSWEESNSGLPESARNVMLISIAPSDPDVLWIGISPQFGLGAKNVYKTTDAAESWGTVTTIKFSATCITIDPSDADVVYLGIGFQGNGVLKTSDGGVIFVPLSEGLAPTLTQVNDIAIDPMDTRIVYAGTGLSTFPSAGFGLYSLDTVTGLKWDWIECPGVDPIGLSVIAIDPWADDRVLCAFPSNSLLAHDKTVAPRVAISISTDRNQYAAGDTQIARISAANTGGDIDVDLYIAIMLPDGSLLFWPGFASEMSAGFSMTPMPRGFSMTDVAFFDMALPDSLPVGNYIWFGMFYGQGTQNAVSNLASAGWTLLP